MRVVYGLREGDAPAAAAPALAAASPSAPTTSSPDGVAPTAAPASEQTSARGPLRVRVRAPRAASSTASAAVAPAAVAADKRERVSMRSRLLPLRDARRHLSNTLLSPSSPRSLPSTMRHPLVPAFVLSFLVGYLFWKREALLRRIIRPTMVLLGRGVYLVMQATMVLVGALLGLTILFARLVAMPTHAIVNALRGFLADDDAYYRVHGMSSAAADAAAPADEAAATAAATAPAARLGGRRHHRGVLGRAAWARTMFMFRTLCALETAIVRLRGATAHDGAQRQRRAPLARRHFAEVSDLYEHVIRDGRLSIDDTRHIFTLLSAEEQRQTARQHSDDEAEAAATAAAATTTMMTSDRLAPWSDARRAIEILNMCGGGGVPPGSWQAAAAQILLPYLPRLSTALPTDAHDADDDADGGAAAWPTDTVLISFASTMLPSVTLGSALLAAACGARVAIVDDWRRTLRREYAAFFASLRVNAHAPLWRARQLLDRYGVAILRSPLDFAPAQALRDGARLGWLDTLAPLANAYDDVARFVAGGGSHGDVRETAHALAFFAPAKAWTVDCAGVSCALPIGETRAYEVVSSRVAAAATATVGRAEGASGGGGGGEQRQTRVEQVHISPLKHHIPECELAALVGADAEANADMLLAALGGEPGPLSNAIIMHAAALVLVAGLVTTFHEGVMVASRALIDGDVRELWREWSLATSALR